MNKDFSETKLLSMPANKQFKVLYDLARFIETHKYEVDSNHFQKLAKYHQYLSNTEDENIQKLNKEFAKISAADYQFQIYLMNLERLLGQSKKDYDFLVNTGDKTHNSKKSFPIICLLDSIRSAHNVGSFFRNAECFGVQEVILCGLSPTPESVHVQKTSMGCDENVKWSYAKNAQLKVKELKDQGYKIIGIETSKDALDLNHYNSNLEKTVLIFGHEQFGISLELLQECDETFYIPLYGDKNSLNVSISNAIVLNKLTSLDEI